MTTELYILGATLLLAIVQMFLASSARTSETGLTYNMSARDNEGPPMRAVTGRLQRAFKNLYETLPLFIAAVLIVSIAHRESMLSLYGAWLYLIGRIIYVPLYAAGIPVLRSLVWFAALIGLLMVIAASMLSF